MKTSIATVSISGNFAEKLEAIAAAGFHGLEIFEQDFIAHDANPREVGEMIRAMGLEITIFQPFRDFEGLPDPLRAKAFDRAALLNTTPISAARARCAPRDPVRVVLAVPSEAGE